MQFDYIMGQNVYKHCYMSLIDNNIVAIERQ